MQKQERLDFDLCGQYIQITARLKTASTISVFENSRPIHSDQSFIVSSKHHYGLCGQQTQIRVLLYAESTSLLGVCRQYIQIRVLLKTASTIGTLGNGMFSQSFAYEQTTPSGSLRSEYFSLLAYGEIRNNSIWSL